MAVTAQAEKQHKRATPLLFAQTGPGLSSRAQSPHFHSSASRHAVQAARQKPYLSLQLPFFCLQLVLHLLGILSSSLIPQHLPLKPADLQTEHRPLVLGTSSHHFFAATMEIQCH